MTAENTAAETESAIEINKEAYRELVQAIKALGAEAAAAGKHKTAKKLEEIRLKAVEVRALLNDKVSKIKEARNEIAALNAAVSALEESAANEPVVNTFSFTRHVSVYTDTASRVRAGEEPIADSYNCLAPVSDVVSRIKPIVSATEGVIGTRVIVSEGFGHTIMFHELVGLVELRERRKLDVINNVADAASIYVEGVTLAVRLADQYAQSFGAYAAIPVVSRNNMEASLIPADAVVADSLEVEAEIEDEDSDEESEEVEGEADSDEDGVDDEDADESPSDELAGEEDEDADALDSEDE